MDIGGDTTSMNSSDGSNSDSGESVLGSSSSNVYEGRDDIDMPFIMEIGGAEGGDDKEVLRAQVSSLEDLVSTLRQRQMEDRDVYR